MAPKRPYGDGNFPYAKRYRNQTMPQSSAISTPRSSARNSTFMKNYKQRGGYSRRYTGNNIMASTVYPAPEAKVVDNVISPTSPASNPVSPITATGGILQLNPIAQGVGASQRVGITTVAKSIAYRFEVDLGPTPLATSGRVILFWDKNPNASIPAVTDVLATAAYNSFINLSNKDRFIILRNDLFSLSPNGDQTFYKEGFVKLGYKSEYLNSATVIPNQGGLFILTIGDQGTVANQPLLNITTRFRFLDN